MVTASEMYWLTRLDSIKELIGMTGTVMVIICGMIAGILGVLFSLDPPGDLVKKTKNILKFWIVVLIVGFFFLVANVFIPTTKEYAAIKVVPAILNNELEEDLGDVYDLGMEWAKDQLKEMKGGDEREQRK